jgi:AcrR family transcriptional regulator
MAKTPTTTSSRPRDAKATQELLLAGATEEFAEYGLAGARIDRIAERAGANKRLLYVYFGNKDDLFDAVIERHVGVITDAVPLDPEDLGAYAGAVFDHVLANPQTLRLVAWRDFERAEATDAERASYQHKLRAIREAQRAGKVYDGMAAADLLAMTMRLATSWLGAPAALKLAAGRDPMSRTRLRHHRTALVEAVGRIAEPR